MQKKLQKKLLTVPGPTPHPLLGPAGNLLAGFLDPIANTGNLIRAYGPVFTLVAGGGTRMFSPLPDCPGSVGVCGPALATQVFNQVDIFHHFPLSGQLYPMGAAPLREDPLRHWGVGLMGLNGEIHRQRRRMMMPAFHRQGIKAYHQIIAELTEEMLRGWKSTERRNLHDDLLSLTRRIATRTLFGQDLPDGGEQVGLTMQRMIKMVYDPFTVLLAYDRWPFPYRRFLDLAAELDAELKAIIARRRANDVPAHDLLSALLAMSDDDDNGLTNDELLGHLSLLFLAAHDSTANALTWTLFLLTQHPQVMAVVFAELDGMLNGEPPTPEQLGRLPVLERVVRESLRILPPAPFGARIAVQDTELGGFAIPRGTEVLVDIYHTHHMPELYTEPECFDPERWLDAKMGTYQYVPFGGGPHNCIGSSFAEMEMKIVLAILLQRFRLEFPAGGRIDRTAGFTLGPRQGMPMIVHLQDGAFAESVGAVRGNVREMVKSFSQ